VTNIDIKSVDPSSSTIQELVYCNIVTWTQKFVKALKQKAYGGLSLKNKSVLCSAY
jgi:hypothetical protein